MSPRDATAPPRTATETASMTKSNPETETGSPSVFRVDNVTVRFPGMIRPALADVSLDMRPGEFLVLVGRSGSGKTTILNLVAGEVEPTTGSVEVLGGPPAQARHQLGYMLARDALLPWRTAVRNVELPLELDGVAKRPRREAALEMLERVQLRESASRLPWQLSQGMRQRVALARTWARRPDLLLMDEPFSALDVQTRLEVQETFLDVWQGTRSAALMVTHDLSEALLLGDRVLLISQGRILREVTVPFERPRSLHQLSSTDAFRRLEADLWNDLI